MHRVCFMFNTIADIYRTAQGDKGYEVSWLAYNIVILTIFRFQPILF